MSKDTTVDSLVWLASDFSSHVQLIIESVNRGNVVKFDNDQLDHCIVMSELINDPEKSDQVNAYLSSLSPFTSVSNDFIEMINDKLEQLAQEAALSYTGEYDV